jgi:hypothetical protein
LRRARLVSGPSDHRGSAKFNVGSRQELPFSTASPSGSSQCEAAIRKMMLSRK